MFFDVVPVNDSGPDESAFSSYLFSTLYFSPPDRRLNSDRVSRLVVGRGWIAWTRPGEIDVYFCPFLETTQNIIITDEEWGASKQDQDANRGVCMELLPVPLSFRCENLVE